MTLSESNRVRDTRTLFIPAASWPLGLLRAAPTEALALARRFWGIPLEWRFLLFSIVVLLTGAFVIGSWTSREIKNRVIERSAATNALYVDSLVSPLLAPLEDSNVLPPESRAALGGLLEGTALGEEVVAFKVWSPSGTVLYATDQQLIGQAFPIGDDLQRAAGGEVSAHVTDLQEAENVLDRTHGEQLIETYAPVRSPETGRVIAISEFYQFPDDILGEAQASQRDGWLIVGGATLVMFLVLNGMVRQATATIRRQNQGLEHLNRQVRAASAANVQTEEQVMARIAQDLHDEPAQNLAVALLRMDRLSAGIPPDHQETWTLVQQSVQGALSNLRSISGGIRIPDIEELGPAALISRAVSDFEQRTGQSVSVRTAAVPASLWAAAKVALFRIIQEALNNSFIHGQALRRSVTATVQGDFLEVQIADDGEGFDPEAVAKEGGGERPRLGIRGMRERVELLGGTFRIISRPGEGTKVLACIPLHEVG